MQINLIPFNSKWYCVFPDCKTLISNQLKSSVYRKGISENYIKIYWNKVVKQIEWKYNLLHIFIAYVYVI